jgi:PPM family protein phosphatase
VRLVGGAHSDTGRVRSNNQDAALISEHLALFAVADGMGGHRGGEVASALALEALRGRLDDGALDSSDTLVEAVLDANDRVFDQSRNDPDLFGMGTTLCALALVGHGGPDEHLAIVNVGDSRAYVLGSDGELTQLTEDHSLVQTMVRDGQLTADEAAVHPQRNILTRALGIEPEVDVDWWLRPVVAGERYLLCSDGLFNEVSEARIAATLRSLADPTEAAKALVGLANSGGGRDNITCVVVDVADDDATAVVPPVAEATAAQALAAELAPPPPEPEPRPRRLTPRLIGFVVLVLAVGGGAYIAIRTWADRNYFVAADGTEVAIFRGRPDGVLWFEPRRVAGTGIRLADLSEDSRQKVEDGYETASRSDAEDWATLLTSTTTTIPPPTTTSASTVPPGTVPGSPPAASTTSSVPPTTGPPAAAATTAPRGSA